MSERIRTATTGYHHNQQTNKMPDLGPRKTLLVLVIVVGCFAVLWPKVFYPMLVGSAQHHMKPSDIDRMTGEFPTVATTINYLCLFMDIRMLRCYIRCRC